MQRTLLRGRQHGRGRLLRRVRFNWGYAGLSETPASAPFCAGGSMGAGGSCGALGSTGVTQDYLKHQQAHPSARAAAWARAAPAAR